MAKPVIWTIDDDPEVLRAIERDLRQHYGGKYRILRADSGPKALETLEQLTLRNETVALFLVDQRMPRMTGVQFLEEARKKFPDARRVLLTAYADTDAAIKAINDVRIDFYLLKPWDPPQEKLFPVLDDLLDDWQAAHTEGMEDVRVVGHRWSPDTHSLRDFLARNHVPYRWIDIEIPTPDPATKRLVEAIGTEGPLPVVLFADGSCLGKPTPSQVAEKLGLRTQATEKFYDLAIIGGGPAGLAAAVYGASEGLKTVIIEREAPGGQAGMSSRIENYLGFPVGLSGADLARRAVAQATRFGVEMLTPQEATKLRCEDNYRILTLADGSEISCHALLITTGVSWRKLDVPGVEDLSGAGVYYGAAMVEALGCAEGDVYVVGGANSAGQAAMYFSNYARSVTMLVRGDGLAASMSQYLINQIGQTENIRVQSHTEVTRVEGENNLERLTWKNNKTGEEQTVPAIALLIFIGAQPHTDWLDGFVARDDKGFLLTGPDLLVNGRKESGWPLSRDPYLLESSVPGVFVAGDVRHGSVKRVASGVGEGSIAVQFIHQYLSKVQ